MRLASIAAVALLLLAPALAEAGVKKPAAAAAVRQNARFLGKDPHGPLAVVKKGKLGAGLPCRLPGTL